MGQIFPGRDDTLVIYYMVPKVIRTIILIVGSKFMDTFIKF